MGTRRKPLLPDITICLLYPQAPFGIFPLLVQLVYADQSLNNVPCAFAEDFPENGPSLHFDHQFATTRWP